METNNIIWDSLPDNKTTESKHDKIKKPETQDSSVSTDKVDTEPSSKEDKDKPQDSKEEISKDDDKSEEEKKSTETSTDTEEDKKQESSSSTTEDEPKHMVDSSTDTEEDLNIQTSKMILSIQEEAIITLKLSITYFDNMIRTSYIKMGDIVKIHAIQPIGKLNVFEGLVKLITKNKDEHYLICLDCAHDYKSEIVYINTQSIRAVEKIIVPKDKKNREE